MKSVFSTKFVKTINTLTVEELQSFDVWLNSPWCNSNKNLIKLFRKLKKYYPEFDNPKLTKEKLLKQILPNSKFSEERINNLFSEAYLATEQFMIFQNLKKDRSLQKDLLTKEFQNRDLEDWFFKETNKEIERIEKKEIKDWEDHFHLLELNRRMYHHPNQNPRMKPGGQTIVKMGEQLDLLYLLERAAIINEKIFRNRLLKNENHDVEQELRIWKMAAEGIEHPAIKLYKIRLENKEEDLLKDYFRLRVRFLNIYEELNKKEQKVHLISLLNDSTKLYKKNLLSIKEFLPLYKIGLKTEILLHNGNLTGTTFSIIVSASNISKDFEFTRYFIDSYTEKLNESIQKDANAWANAHTLYNQDKLNNCLDILINHIFKNNQFQVYSKLLTTQVYFDLHLKNDSYSSFLFNYFDSFEKWITREKFKSQNFKKSYLRFIQLSRTLAKHFSSIDFQPEKVNVLLNNEVNVQAVGWIEEKIEEILILKKGRP